MQIGLWGWLILLALIGLVWLSRHYELGRARRTERTLSSASHPGPAVDPPRVSVLVAAKDEEVNIGTCVGALLRQDYPNFEVLAIDDRSRDRTPEILRLLAEQHPDKLRVITVTELREGWFGKNNAMREGVSAATGQWLCFTDADCTQTSPRTLTAAIGECRGSGAEFLSILPVLVTRSFWERIIQPVCAGILMLWFRPAKVNHPRSSAAYANGAFMLIRRDVYDAIGGHEGVKTQVNEDMHLARLAKQRGFRLQVIQNEDLYTTHMYASLAAAWRGWTRIFYGCLGSFRRLLLAWLVLTLFSLVPWVSLVISSMAYFGGWEPRSPWRGMLAASAVVVLLMQSVVARFYAMVRIPARYSLGYLLGAVITWGMLIAAMTKLGGGTSTTWRGTTYRGDRLESAAAKPSSLSA